MRRFESSRPSQAAGSPGYYFPAGQNRRHSHGLGWRGSITLPNRARNKSRGTSGSRRGDGFAPRLHGRCLVGPVRCCLGEMALDIECGVGGCVHREKSLHGSRALETLHLAFSSPGRLMRIPGSVVAPSTAFTAFCDSNATCCGPIRSQGMRDELVGDIAIFLQQLAHHFERRPLVPPGLNRHFALGVDCAPLSRPSERRS